MTIATQQENTAVVHGLETYYKNSYPEISDSEASKLHPKNSALLLGRLVFTSLLVCRAGLSSELPENVTLVGDKEFKNARTSYLNALCADTEEVLEPVFDDLLRTDGLGHVITESLVAVPILLHHETQMRNLIYVNSDPLWRERRKTRRNNPSTPPWRYIINNPKHSGSSSNPARMAQIAGEYVRVSTSILLEKEEARLHANRDYAKEI